VQRVAGSADGDQNQIVREMLQSAARYFSRFAPQPPWLAPAMEDCRQGSKRRQDGVVLWMKFPDGHPLN
jgi:hypothetical protein